jgi:hypothetical protein
VSEFDDALDGVEQDAVIEQLRSKNARLELSKAQVQAELAAIKAELRLSEGELDRARAVLGLLHDESGLVPKWTLPPTKKGEQNVGIPVFVFSDTHYGEVVNDAEVYGYNKYNVTIQEMRTKRFAEGAIKVTRDYLSGSKKLRLDGCVLMIGGDLVSGGIHQELLQTDEMTAMEASVHFAPLVAAVVLMLLEEFGAVHVMSVPGNHDRLYKKIPSKKNAQNAASWVFTHMVKMALGEEREITWDISPSRDAYFKIYNTAFALTHGDQFRGGDGQVGAIGPVKRGQLRKSARDHAMGLDNDIMVLGHFHQWLSAPGQGLIMNGSLKGYDEYAFGLNLMPELAQQALFVVTPEYGVTFQAPIIVAKRDAEGW